jgi:hypothetical protein
LGMMRVSAVEGVAGEANDGREKTSQRPYLPTHSLSPVYVRAAIPKSCRPISHPSLSLDPRPAVCGLSTTVSDERGRAWRPEQIESQLGYNSRPSLSAGRGCACERQGVVFAYDGQGAAKNA